jgi:pyruvate dehydrogenase E2 component (dihydrolipoamide acetyltransferase)
MRRLIQQDDKGRWFYQLDEDLKGNAMAYLPGPIPCVTTTSIDMTEAGSLRKRLEKEQGIRISTTSLLIKAAAIALTGFPILGGKWESIDRIRCPDPEEIDINGPIQVVDTIGFFSIDKANQKTLLQISEELEAQVNEARAADKVRWPEQGLTGPSFWISNVGTIGPVEDAYGPVAWFATSILGVSAILKKPAVKDGQIAIRQMMNVSLIWDHRAMMANTPIEFLTQLKRNLEEPATYLA